VTNPAPPLISLLGPVFLAGGGGTSAGPPRQACVLAALALHAGSPVTMDTLTDRAWGDEPGSRSALYTVIARLRRLLEPLGIPLTQRGGAYVLDVEKSLVDIHRMRDLAGQAREEAPSAPGLIREALDLWRGEPLTGVRGDWAERVRVGLAAERLALYGRLYDAELAAGRHAAVVGELAELVARFPYDEPVTAHYLLALHRTGRTAEALAAYRGTRDLLRAELGVQPGRDLDDLHRRILRDDPALRAGAAPAARPVNRPLPRQLPIDLSTFTGRAETLAELDGLLDGDGVPRAGLIAMTGAGGMGKTALAVHWAHRVARHFPDGQLYVDLRGFAQQAPADPGAVLAAFLRGLGVGADEIPAETGERAALYRSLTAGRRLLILLDNAHDPAQVRPLLPGSGSSLVLLTSRVDPRGLVVSHDVRVLPLDVLSAEEASGLFHRLVGPERARPGEAAVAEITDLCGRLPLALRLAASQLVFAPGLTPTGLLARWGRRDRLAALSVPGDDGIALRTTFDLSYDALPEAARRLFRLFGAHPAVHPETRSLAAMAGLDTPTTTALLDELVAGHLVQRVDEDRVGAHDLLREYAADRAGAEDSLDDAYTRMYDWYLAASFAARRTVAGIRPWYRHGPVKVELPELDSVAEALRWLDSRHETLTTVAAHAAANGRPEHATHQASALWRYFYLRWHLDRWITTSRIGLLAAERLPDREQEGNTLLELGHVYELLGRIDEAEELYRSAYDIAVEREDVARLGDALESLAGISRARGDYDDAVGHLTRSLEISESVGDPHGTALSLIGVADIDFLVGDLAAAGEKFSRARDILEGTGHHREHAEAIVRIGHVRLAEGEFDTAAELIAEGAERLTRHGVRAAAVLARGILALVDARRGDHVTALHAFRGLLAEADELSHDRLRLEILNLAAPSQLAVEGGESALEFALEALTLAGKLHETHMLAVAHQHVAEARAATGDVAGAKQSRRAAIRLLKGTGIET